MILEALESSGTDLEAIVRELPVSLDELRDARARISWDTFIEFLERVDRACGSAMPIEEVGARILEVPAFHLLRRAGQFVVSPRHLYEIAGRLVAPALFPNVIVKQEWLRSGRLVVTGELLPGCRASTAFFRLCHGNVAALPRLLDLPASIIEEQTITGRQGRLVLQPPSSHTIGVRVVRGVRSLGALSEAWRGVVRHQHELEASIAALRSSRHELQQLLERLPDGVLIHKDGIVRWANAAFVEVVGVESVEQIVGRNIVDFVPSKDRAALVHAMRNAALNEVSNERQEYWVQRPDGTRRRLQAGAAQLVEFGGEPSRLVVLRDVTEHHRLREQAAISGRLASIGALAAGVAHEINNPLAYVRLNLDMAARQIPVGASRDLEASLGVAREGTERVIGIVRDLKILSRVHDEPSEAVDVPAVIDSMLALAERAVTAKARVFRSYGPTPLALGSRGKLGQVFVNLFANAADAIPSGAPSEHSICITTGTDAAGRAVVEITDSGSGIAPEIADRIFDPFFTTKPVGVGTGLGLAMCHRIITELGGEIGFESTPGETTFRIALPPAEGSAESNDLHDSPARSRSRARLLVVEDEPALLRSIVTLASDVHEVVGTASARQALEILDGDERFDAVLTDVMMADLTGMDLYEHLRVNRRGFERRIVFMTGGALTEPMERFLDSVPNRCLAKPFGMSELLEAVDAALTESTS